MKELKFNSGGQPFFNRDFELWHNQMYTALEGQYAGQAGFVFSGCVVSGTTISSGLVYLSGKIREFGGGTVVGGFPCHIRAVAVAESDSRLHVDISQSLTTRREYGCELVSGAMAADSGNIEVLETGAVRRFILPTKLVSYVRTGGGFLDFNTNNNFQSKYFRFFGPAYVSSVPNTAGLAKVDKLGELNNGGLNGEFVAKETGFYSFSGILVYDTYDVLDSSTSTIFWFVIEMFVGGAWVVCYELSVPKSRIESETLSFATSIEVAAGGKVRVGVMGGAYRFSVGLRLFTVVRVG